jgi:hypothetical protein
MARTFKHVEITFRRTVTQEQTVTVAVPPEFADDGAMVDAYLGKVAPKRLKDRGWMQVGATAPKPVEGDK